VAAQAAQANDLDEHLKAVAAQPLCELPIESGPGREVRAGTFVQSASRSEERPFFSPISRWQADFRDAIVPAK